eukprot:CAMPEP_0198581466 /NCGR_PEP_ID=MMETSP1462-20131121/124271_1 /TAXON_ID=1333877 /ORGANISM="Brandtodinium nutriculum, Strain RCC3387" /LENGTH=97 /DNA_ID=CAMNT_0044312841 /DNA_START=12 /DNA_END=301 /DNA_ORIENTATION=+
MCGMLVMSLAAYELSKETRVPENGVMRTVDGDALVQVAQQRQGMPLGSLLYLTTPYHQQLEYLTVKVDEGRSELTFRVQEVTFSPAPEPVEGVKRPA